MKVFVVYADTYDDSWGCQISLFGIYDSYERAEAIVEELIKENRLYYQIEELTMNECKETYLGGYYE